MSRAKHSVMGVAAQVDPFFVPLTEEEREAIERLGYEYEETEYFFYVMEYLKYVSSQPN